MYTVDFWISMFNRTRLYDCLWWEGFADSRAGQNDNLTAGLQAVIAQIPLVNGKLHICGRLVNRRTTGDDQKMTTSAAHKFDRFPAVVSSQRRQLRYRLAERTCRMRRKRRFSSTAVSSSYRLCPRKYRSPSPKTIS